MRKTRRTSLALFLVLLALLTSCLMGTGGDGETDRNMVVNGDFESIGYAWAYIREESNTEGTWVNDAAIAYEGNGCLAIAMVDNTWAKGYWRIDTETKAIPVMAATEYLIAGYMRAENLADDGHSSATLQVYEYDSSYNLISPVPAAFTPNLAKAANNSQWSLYSQTFTTSPNAAYVQIRFFFQSGSSVPKVFLDSVYFGPYDEKWDATIAQEPQN